MSQDRVMQLREQIFLIERQIAPLEWDASRNQINQFKKIQLGRLKEQRQTLQNELHQLAV